MPKVGKRHFKYTKSGKAAAKQYAKKLREDKLPKKVTRKVKDVSPVLARYKKMLDDWGKQGKAAGKPKPKKPTEPTKFISFPKQQRTDSSTTYDALRRALREKKELGEALSPEEIRAYRDFIKHGGKKKGPKQPSAGTAKKKADYPKKREKAIQAGIKAWIAGKSPSKAMRASRQTEGSMGIKRLIRKRIGQEKGLGRTVAAGDATHTVSQHHPERGKRKLAQAVLGTIVDKALTQAHGVRGTDVRGAHKIASGRGRAFKKALGGDVGGEKTTSKKKLRGLKEKKFKPSKTDPGWMKRHTQSRPVGTFFPTPGGVRGGWKKLADKFGLDKLKKALGSMRQSKNEGVRGVHWHGGGMGKYSKERLKDFTPATKKEMEAAAKAREKAGKKPPNTDDINVVVPKKKNVKKSRAKVRKLTPREQAQVDSYESEGGDVNPDKYRG